jgi:hypothetical protein
LIRLEILTKSQGLSSIGWDRIRYSAAGRVMSEHAVAISSRPLSLPELTNLSLAAAMQLDRLLQHSPIDEAPLHRLSASLREAAPAPRDSDSRLFQSSPATLRVLSRALTHVGSKKLSTIAELNSEMNHYIQMFTSQPKNWSEDVIRRSLAFCVSLHRELVSEVSRLESPSPTDDWSGATWTTSASRYKS